ncbi:hypothetical protein BS47DRAFT_1272504, partial [Hydnum rufescens UP504]
KYPLACVDQVSQLYGSDTCMGYDVGCSFASTAKYSQLGPCLLSQGMSFIVSSFHGYAHNHLCQLNWLSLYHNGVGMEDFKGYEQIFSASNALSCVTHYASPYNHCQVITLHFEKWNNEKHANLADFIIGNYKATLKVLHDAPLTLEKFSYSPWNIDPDMAFPKYQQEEYTFLKSLKDEPPGESIPILYLEALQKLEETQ